LRSKGSWEGKYGFAILKKEAGDRERGSAIRLVSRNVAPRGKRNVVLKMNGKNWCQREKKDGGYTTTGMLKGRSNSIWQVLKRERGRWVLRRGLLLAGSDFIEGNSEFPAGKGSAIRDGGSGGEQRDSTVLEKGSARVAFLSNKLASGRSLVREKKGSAEIYRRF